MKGWELAMNGDPVKQFLDMRPLVASMLVTLGSAQDRSQALDVLSDCGIVATSQTPSSQAGTQVLARGGGAIDAAIAANAQKLKGKPSGLPRVSAGV
jgi:hypothetical protein